LFAIPLVTYPEKQRSPFFQTATASAPNLLLVLEHTQSDFPFQDLADSQLPAQLISGVYVQHCVQQFAGVGLPATFRQKSQASDKSEIVTFLDCVSYRTIAVDMKAIGRLLGRGRNGGRKAGTDCHWFISTRFAWFKITWHPLAKSCLVSNRLLTGCADYSLPILPGWALAL
jgi:hypothetical protein